ncbi:hypothetical protein BGZ70_002019 [Mortierella alpina]|uniref:Uncharacterized protein n=1 Tax=Mortierella alpina TaxID=64518 RepID=A0A9P6LXK4_MORAP|nr:hypothetical protein BGZ70_002019 [Mortierella alpina]
MSMLCHYQIYCAHKPVPPGTPGISIGLTPNNRAQCNRNNHQDEEDEKDVEDVEYTVEAVRSFDQTTLHRLMELQTALEHIQELRQELQEERSTRKLMLKAFEEAEIENRKERSTGRLTVQALMEAQAAHQEERQEWTVERLSLLAHLETQQKERQEDEERISSIESRLGRSIIALGDDTVPYRTPNTSDSIQRLASFLPGNSRQCE